MSPWTKSNYWHKPTPLVVHPFAGGSYLSKSLPESRQTQYLVRYLAGLGCTAVLCEENYFDRDYLSEFREFYSASSRGYPNICGRLHFFSGEGVDDALLNRALTSEPDAVKRLQDGYLGFCVLRPLPGAVMGKTVIKWYPDNDAEAARITAKREYKAHIAGIEFSVKGIAWQQQDTAVGACATVALWSALHSSTFNEHHAVPTTAEITKAAHRTASLGNRVFPTAGLTSFQMLEAIKELGLSPVVEQGELPDSSFSRERFSAICSAFVRSGYPVIIGGKVSGGESKHAVCIVGYREPAPSPAVPGDVKLYGQNISYFYVHDDNLGPNVRFEISSESTPGNPLPAKLAPKAPDTAKYWSEEVTDATANYWTLIPDTIIAAVQPEIKTSPTALSDLALVLTKAICAIYGHINRGTPGTPALSATAGTHFLLRPNYFGQILETTLGADPVILGRVRRELWEGLSPLSGYLGVIRIWIEDRPVVDFLVDTSDNDRNLPLFGFLTYDAPVDKLVQILASVPALAGVKSLGVRVKGH